MITALLLIFGITVVSIFMLLIIGAISLSPVLLFVVLFPLLDILLIWAIVKGAFGKKK